MFTRLLKLLTLASVTVGAAVAFAGWRWVTPIRRPACAYPDGLQMETVRLASADGTSLFGVCLAGREGAPGIVLCHGYFRDHFEPLDVGVALNQAGYHVLLFDFRGCGQSDGGHTTVGYRETEDVAAAIQRLRSRLDGRPLGVLGISMGAAAAIMAAQTADVAAIVADSPFAHLQGVMEQKVRDFTPHPWLIPLSWASICLGEALSGGDFRAVRPVDSVRKMPATPIMVIHGERDEFVSGDQIEELIQATAGPKELWILDCGHAMARLEHADQYKDRVLRFFDSHLRPNRESGDELGRLGDDN